MNTDTKVRPGAKKDAKSRRAKPDSAGVDPRIQARRAEVEQDASRRQRRTVAALTLVTLVAAAAMVLVRSSWLDVDQITIDGAVNSDVVAVRDATGIKQGDQLLELDLNAAAENVERLAWVQSATLERKLNGNLTIRIEERVAYGAIPSKDGLMLVDSTGRQLAEIDQLPSGFLAIEGIETSGVVGTPAPPAAQAALRLIASLPESLTLRVAKVYFEELDLFLGLAGGGHVLLGNDSGLTEKLVGLETMVSQVDLRCLWRIDLRVPSAPALTRVSSEGEIGATLTNLTDCS